jgi:hypothetical protein
MRGASVMLACSLLLSLSCYLLLLLCEYCYTNYCNNQIENHHHHHSQHHNHHSQHLAQVCNISEFKTNPLATPTHGSKGK